jgi:hypothetical protein
VGILNIHAPLVKQVETGARLQKGQLRYPGRPTTNDVVTFYRWLGTFRAELLLDSKQGGSYHHPKVDLHDSTWGDSCQ